MTSPFDLVTFDHGPEMKNRFMLAPLTNQQSHADGTLSDDEFGWLLARSEGGFGMTMTCAAYVQAAGQGFAGQLGCFSDDHLAGLARLAAAIKTRGSMAIMQLHHAGMRSPAELTGHAPLAPFADSETGARALTTPEVEGVIDDFASAARRGQMAGFDGVELHGAHGYLLCQFFDPERNLRDDNYGGSFDNRVRILFDIIKEVRARCGDSFHLSVRLSPERFGVSTAEMIEIFRQLVAAGDVDLIDLSLWDSFKVAIDPEFVGRSLLGLFTDIDRQSVRLAAAGKLHCGADVQRALDAGVDVVALGRAAITNHDFPEQMRRDPQFAMRTLPVTASELRAESLGDSFIQYMRGWRGFVED